MVAILDQFHFFVSPTDVSHSLTEGQSADEPCSTELISKEVGEEMETEDEDARNISNHIHKAIVTIILPSLQSVLTLQVNNISLGFSTKVPVQGLWNNF